MKKPNAAILTGATGGIGQAMARALHAQGIKLILVGRNQLKLKALASDLKQADASTAVYEVVCEISDADSRHDLLDSIKNLPFEVDLLINNAGINDFALFENQSDETIAELLQVNALYPLLLTKLLLPYLAAQSGETQVINVGSTFGNIAYPGFAAYSASKFALRGASEALAREYADSKVRIRYFAPRATRTSLNSDKVVQMNQELKVSMDTPEVVAKAFTAFVCSKKRMQFLGWPEKLFVWVNQILPGVVSGELKKALPVIRKYSTEA